jgi:hypothetical protein
MPRSSSRRPRSRALNLHGYKSALNQIDARLQRLYPELEQAKIDKVSLLLFGPKPDGFSVPTGKESA